MFEGKAIETHTDWVIANEHPDGHYEISRAYIGTVPQGNGAFDETFETQQELIEGMQTYAPLSAWSAALYDAII